MTLTFNLFAQWLQQPQLENDIVLHDVKIDSREVEPGDLFIAIAGPNFDGHQFIDQALSRGAVAIMVERAVNLSAPLLQVESSLKSLGELAHRWRKQINPTVVAVTGSCGKTTVKKFVTEILRYVHGDEAVCMAPRNYNSISGLPLAILQLRPHHRYAVWEMGMDRFGEIVETSALALPDIAAINLVAPVHLEYVGDLAGVARAKGEIFIGLKEQGCAILNSDLPFVEFWQSLLQPQQQTLTFAQHQAADVKVSNVSSDFNCCRFDLVIKGHHIAIELSVPGCHQAMNAACAAAIASALSVTPAAIATGLHRMKGVKRRFQPLMGKGGCTLIDDGYNASPASVRAAIDVLAQFSGRKVLLLGAMRELGDNERVYHREIGRYAREHGIDHLLTVGDIAEEAATAFGQGGGWFADHQDLVAAAQPLLTAETAVVVKGSLSMNMAVVVEALLPE
ncbi:MAG: UDP-N-acetylmuramoyl-tripeptide--D-alanyl-D-alanine ligase [Gammaproteobacteria bacterium]|nr:UDP-N-acetylmuramoyl-tripeptide--D-alanyl-D-alanine ligase [Gammaproteobacteria bacterium]